MILGLAAVPTVANVSRGGITRVDAKGKKTIVLPPITIKGRLPKAAKKKAKPGIVEKTAAALTSPTAAVVSGGGAASQPISRAMLLLGGLGAALVLLGGFGQLRIDGRRRKRSVRNPASAAHHDDPRVARAVEFRKEFHWGIPAKRISSRRVSPAPEVLVELGRLQQVTYETHKRGEPARFFVHDFEGQRPSLCMDIENDRLHVVGGSYTVTDRGIEG